MNDLLIKALITVMIIDAGMHFYYDYKKNTYQSLKFLILTVLMAVSVGAALTKQETDNVQQRMKIIEQKIDFEVTQALESMADINVDDFKSSDLIEIEEDDFEDIEITE